MRHQILIAGLVSFLLGSCSTISEQPPPPSADERNIYSIYPEYLPLDRIDPIPETRRLIENDKYAEANDYLSYFMDFDYVKDRIEAKELYKNIQDTRSDWLYRLKELNKGFFLGKSDEPEGEAAAVVSDFLVIGDLRDLKDEGQKYLQGQDVDKVTTTLAGIGVGASAVVILNSAKPAVSFLKMTSKTGKMPDWLGKFIIKTAKDQDRSKSLGELKGFLDELRGLYQTAGARSTLELLSKSKSLEDFRKLSKFGKEFGGKTSTLLKVGGDDAISLYQRNNRYSKSDFLEASSFGQNGIRSIEKNPSQFQKFLSVENAARRRMTNFELRLISSGKRTTVLGNDVVKRDQLFDPRYLDSASRSNVERMKSGYAPIARDGNPINLHHMKQQKNGTLVELSVTEHREHSTLLHRYTKASEIDRSEFDLLRPAYWKMRAKDFE